MKNLQKERLKKELKLNEKSFKAGIISEKQYLKTKAIIHKNLRKTSEQKEATVNEILANQGSGKNLAHLWKMVSIVLALILVLSVLTYGFRFRQPQSEEGDADLLIFLYSDACADFCESAEPVVRDVAEKAGIKFITAKYIEPVTVPGYVLLYRGSLKIGGISEPAEFVNTFCEITANSDVCG